MLVSTLEFTNTCQFLLDFNIFIYGFRLAQLGTKWLNNHKILIIYLVVLVSKLYFFLAIRV